MRPQQASTTRDSTAPAAMDAPRSATARRSPDRRLPRSGRCRSSPSCLAIPRGAVSQTAPTMPAPTRQRRRRATRRERRPPGRTRRAPNGHEDALEHRLKRELADWDLREAASRRHELRGVLVRAALAAGVCLPRLSRRTRSVAEEPGAHPRMPRLRSPNVDHGRDGDAPLQVTGDGVAPGRAPHGRAPHGNALERHVGSPVRVSARHHVQDRLVVGTEAPTSWRLEFKSASWEGGRGAAR